MCHLNEKLKLILVFQYCFHHENVIYFVLFLMFNLGIKIYSYYLMLYLHIYFVNFTIIYIHISYFNKNVFN
jgi:hypothetical protein